MENKTDLIPSNLVAQVAELLGGATIEKISTPDELNHSVELIKLSKRTIADLKTTKDSADCDVVIYRNKYQSALAEFTTRIEALEALNKNLSRVGSEYLMEEQRKERAAREAAERAELAERKRLAEIENQKLIEEDRLRREAQEKAAAAEREQDAAKRAVLIEQANTAAACADIMQAEVFQVAEQQQVVQAAYVPSAPKVFGFKAKMVYTAEITDYRKAMTWIVENHEWGTIENETFNKCVQSAINKVAKNKQKFFAVPGCRLVETADATTNSRLK